MKSKSDFVKHYGGIFLCFTILFSCNQIPKELSKEEIFSTAQQDTSVIFAPGLVSTHLAERDAALSPDGSEFYYTISSFIRPTIAFIQKQEGKWDTPRVASFSGVYSDLEPHFSPNGNRLYFASNRPLEEGGEPKDFDIWYVERTENNWSKPINLGQPVNTPANEFYPSIAKSGTIYWCATRNDGIGGEDIFFSKLVDEQYQAVQAMPDSINTQSDEYNAFIDPDERYIIFTSHGWGNGFGRGDLWISYRKPDDTWTKPINMGETINTSAFEYCPFVSHDGKYLFFTSDRTNLAVIKSPATYQDIIDFSLLPQNRLSSIYIVKTDIIDRLNH
jgi:hypothetical protein